MSQLHHEQRRDTAEARPRPDARQSHTNSPVLAVLLVLPAVVLLTLFLLWPIVTAVQYSFTGASGFGDADPVGMANYERALTDGAFWGALGRNVVFALIVTAASLAIGFVLAYLLFLRVRGWRGLQVLLMVPYILPVVVTALLWKFMMEPHGGLFNSALRAIGLDALANPWLSSPSTALGSVSLVQVWQITPFAMLLIFGAMIAIPTEVIEAADLDGAGHATKMLRIVLPIVRPAMILTAIVIAIGLFRSFDLIYLLTQGGPINSTTISTLYIYVQGFVNNNYGYANAAGVLVGVFLVALAVIPRIAQRTQRRRAEHAEGTE